VGQVSSIAEESAPRRGLAQVNLEIVQEEDVVVPTGRSRPSNLDSRVIESYPREAQPMYQGGSGYEPILEWAESGFGGCRRVPRPQCASAERTAARETTRASSADGSVPECYFRGDSACRERELLNWLRDEHRADGPQGPITFGISVPMTPHLQKDVGRFFHKRRPSRRRVTFLSEEVVRCGVAGQGPTE
jgi:hypothetical protein